MKTCPPKEQFERLLAEALDAGERGQIETHVEECAACQTILEQLTMVAGIGAREFPRFASEACKDLERGFLGRLMATPPNLTSRDPSGLSNGTANSTSDTVAAADRAAAAELLPKIAGFEVSSILGRGGMGVVYRAEQPRLNRVVALKVIAAGRATDPKYLARFQQEARVIARLHHPNIVQIYEVGESEGQPYLALEFVDGGSLKTRPEQRPYSSREAAELVETLARAMHHAHAHGIVHRDLKPRNILLSNAECGDRVAESAKKDATVSVESRHNGQTSSIRIPHSAFRIPKITDFGLAKLLDDDGDTASGELLGTPMYMAPEQAAGTIGAISPATDIYALGAILYELLTGRPPYEGETALAILQAITQEEPPPPRRLNPRLPRDLDSICLKCLEKEPTRRYASADALADDLQRFLKGEPIQARAITALERTGKWVRRRPAAAAALVLVGLLFLTGFAATTLLWRQAVRSQRAEKAHREVAEQILASRSTALARTAWLTDDFDLARQALSECPPALRDKEWRYLNRVCHAELARLKGHKWALLAVAYSRDGRRLVSGANDGTIKLWDIDQMQLVWDIKDKYPSAIRFAFNADGTRIVLVCLSGPPRDSQSVTAICGLETVSGRELWRWQCDRRIDAIAISPDVQHAVFGDKKAGKLKVIELPTGRETATVPLDPRYSVFRQAFSPDGIRVASALQNGGLLIWEAQTGQPLRRISFATTGGCDVAFSPDGRMVASATNDPRSTSQIVVFDLDSGQLIWRNTTLAQRTDSLVFSPDGRFLASASRADKPVFLWDCESGRELFTFRGHASGVHCLAFSPDRRFLASGGEDQVIHIWDAHGPNGD